MTYSHEQLETIAASLREVVSSKEIKLAWGSLKREELRRAVADGKQVSGYRAEFIIRTKRAIIEVLEEEAVRFNRTYKHDCISSADLCDVVATLLLSLREGGHKPE